MRTVMWRGAMLAGLLAGLPLLALWATGGLAEVTAWAAQGQRAAQNALAGSVRALRGGDLWALAGLLGLAFAYGVFHAAGPGHGKVLIGGYGVARRVRLVPLAGLALVSSLAQATVAVVLVYVGVALFDLTRAAVVDAAEGAMLTASHVGVGLIGLWLAWRGARGLMRRAAVQDHHDHHARDHHHHHAHAHGEACNHRHGPTIEEIEAVTGWREGVALVAGIAARPCTGALLLLILTWQMGIGWAGIAGTYAMGIGTALVTVGVAGLSVWAREGALATLAGGRVAQVLPVLELAAGTLIAAVSVMLVAQAV